MSDLNSQVDPRGLIRESYRIEGISDGECRSIFLDWALFDDHGASQRDNIVALLDHYGPSNSDHPMTAVLKAALEDQATPKRRGGRRGRVE
ncbi:hypothetical protein [Aliiroseovarius sp. 2305UL8-7]|uniref:hypothetical protein n=1 Tax=Aliiroseovarius conchicola TaxID=3121637 RepID=UPI003527F7E6